MTSATSTSTTVTDVITIKANEVATLVSFHWSSGTGIYVKKSGLTFSVYYANSGNGGYGTPMVVVVGPATFAVKGQTAITVKIAPNLAE